jgi:1-aminocyclopropane-1-carboxylate deaminase
MINEALITLDDITRWAPRQSCASIHVLRLDKLHPVVSGNKWYKLKYNAFAAREQGKSTLLTFGGGYSNHLIATAYAAREWGLNSIGLIRGHYDGENFTSTLRTCEACNMQLISLNKSEYDLAKSGKALEAEFPDAYIIPEGGANNAGIRGAAEIAALIPERTTDVCVSIGTGTTLRGLYNALPPGVRLHGFYVAKDFERAVPSLLTPSASGGPQLFIHAVKDQRFGKWSDEAVQFIRTFYGQTSVPLDVVYTSKMMMKVADLLQEAYFGSQSKIVCIHTGGLQGNPAGLFNQ